MGKSRKGGLVLLRENVCVRTDALEGGAADSAYFVRIQGSTKIARTDEPKLKREIYHD